MKSDAKKFKTIVNVVCEGVRENIDYRDTDYFSAENYHSIKEIDWNGKDGMKLLSQHPQILMESNKYFEYGKYEIEVELELDIKEVRQVKKVRGEDVTSCYYYYNGEFINGFLNDDDMWNLEMLFRNSDTEQTQAQAKPLNTFFAYAS
ncbi:MAG: hypothetical protein MUC49_15700 [Raineya sp.]|jgi:hypothetical protein|nr:hypothetical protein [Raineya sp.]